jgi:hypothetical protein
LPCALVESPSLPDGRRFLKRAPKYMLRLVDEAAGVVGDHE